MFRRRVATRATFRSDASVCQRAQKLAVLTSIVAANGAIGARWRRFFGKFAEMKPSSVPALLDEKLTKFFEEVAV